MNYKTFLKSLDKKLDAIEEDSITDEHRVENLRRVWNIGRDVYFYKQESGYTVKQIAGDSGVSQTTLNKFVRAYRLFPKGLKANINGKPLMWAHYMCVVHIASKEGRVFYLTQAALNGWSSHDTRLRIRNNYFENRTSSKGSQKKKAVLKKPDQTLYTYGAKVLKVVDGDTLLLEIDVGFKTSMEHKVRLRGINCAEAKSELGEKAKTFVAQRLMTLEGIGGNIVVRSYKAGKFGRYIADVWYMPQESDKEKIIKDGRLLNQELVDEGLAVLVE